MAETWTEVLDEIKVRGAIPTSQNTFTEDRLLRLANGEMRTKIIPLMSEVREGYYSFDVDTAVNATGLYNISRRAAGGKIIDVKVTDGATVIGDLNRYWEEDIRELDTPPGGPAGFYLKRNQIQLIPRVISGAVYLRQVILLRPLQIVSPNDCAQITAINTVTGVVTCTTVPTSWLVTNTFDLTQATEHYDTLNIDLPISAITTGSGGTLTFTASSLSTRLAVGDWIGLAGTTPVIQCELEMHHYLARLVANTCLLSQGYADAYKLGVEEAKEMKDNLLSLVTPRVENEGKLIINRTGILRRGT